VQLHGGWRLLLVQSGEQPADLVAGQQDHLVTVRMAVAGMRGVYGHVSQAMREELKAALQTRWEESLRQRVALSPVSTVPLLNRLLADVQPLPAH
jgi:hypothetical protein